MKVSLIQMNSTNDKPRNLKQARELMEAAIREDGPDLLVLPEVFDFLGGSGAEKRAAAETIPDGPAYSLCREIAATHKVFVHAGSILEEVPGEERLHNTTIVFDRTGTQIARYRKIHLFDIVTPDGTAYRESAAIKPGDEVVTYDLDGVTVGCSICYDLRFSELFIQLAKKGAQVIALATPWPDYGGDVRGFLATDPETILIDPYRLVDRGWAQSSRTRIIQLGVSDA